MNKSKSQIYNFIKLINKQNFLNVTNRGGQRLLRDQQNCDSKQDNQKDLLR